ncbi:hypothetical protein OQA88_5203 [Cercophora sp. LCS_1]
MADMDNRSLPLRAGVSNLGYGLSSSAASNQASGSATQYNGPVTIHNEGPSRTPTPLPDQRREEILDRLELPQYQDPKDKIPYKANNTGEWFLASAEFQRWRESTASRLLWLSGDVGCGKSVLVKHLAENMNQSSSTICYFFFEAEPGGRGSVVSALRHILSQLFSKDTITLPSETHLLLGAGKKKPWNFDQLWGLLLQTAKQKGVGEIVCLLDAVDDCDPEDWVTLSEHLQQLYTSAKCQSFNLKFLLTSQPYDRIHSRLYDILGDTASVAAHLRGEDEPLRSKISKEIHGFIDVQAQSHALRLGPEARRLLREQLLAVTHMTYLRACHTFKAIEKGLKLSRDQVAEVTWQLSDGLRVTYGKTLSKSGDVNKAAGVLRVVIAAAEPLTVAAMVSVLAILSDGDAFDVDHDNDFIIRETCGLVTVVDSTVRLIEDTVGMLQAQRLPARGSPGQPHSWHSPDSHFTLAQCCIRYLLHVEFAKSPLGRDDPVEPYARSRPFLDYAARHWVFHFRASLPEQQDAMVSEAFRLCDPESPFFLTWFRLHWAATNAGHDTKPPEGFTSLMAVSYLGLSQPMVRELLKGGHSPHARDKTFNRSPLHWAALRGNATIITALLENGSNVVTPGDRADDAPLALAVRSRHTSAVGALLESSNWHLEVTDQDDWSSSGPFQSHDFLEMVKLLLKGGYSPALHNRAGWTLLHAAAGCNHVEALSLLLDQGANMEAMSLDGWTPLMTASRQGHPDSVALLLDRGAAVGGGLAGPSQTTALHLAARLGHVDVVSVFLARGHHTSGLDGSGDSPLDVAATQGQLTIFTILFRALLHPAVPAKNREVVYLSLLKAAAAGKQEVVAWLMGKGFNNEVRNGNGCTAMWLAASNGHWATVECLHLFGASTEAVNGNGSTPLQAAAFNGHERVVRVLLDRGANPLHLNAAGLTAIQLASSRGHGAIVQLLQQRLSALNLLQTWFGVSPPSSPPPYAQPLMGPPNQVFAQMPFPFG